MRNYETLQEEFHRELDQLMSSDAVQKMREYTQHGCVSTYDHCAAVAWFSLILYASLRKRFHIEADIHELLTAAFLHDFYLYDWHDKNHPRLHGFYHPGYAAENAKTYFGVSSHTLQIIRTHMWPLTITHVPASTEAWIVCAADKYAALRETFLRKHGYSGIP